MLVATGQYTGDGTDPRSVTGVGFQPDVVLIKEHSATSVAQMAYSSMSAGEGKRWGNTALDASGRFVSLDADGFTVTSNNDINDSAVVYDYFALRCESADSAVFSYSGDNSDDRSVGSLSFTPDFAMVVSSGTLRVWWRSDQHSGDSSQEHSSASTTNRIQALQSGSIQVGTGLNASGNTYHVWAVAKVAGVMNTVTYAGNGSDDRDIAHGLGAAPALALVQARDTTAQQMVGRFSLDSGDLSHSLGLGTNTTDYIQAMDATNVQVGTDATVNTGTGPPNYTLVTFAANAPSSVIPQRTTTGVGV